MDKWLQALQKTHQAKSPPGSAAAPIADPFLSAVFDTTAVEQENVVADPVGQTVEKAQFNSLAKASIADCAWDEQLAPLVKTGAFIEHSDERLEKACAAIKKIFSNDQEAAEEAIALAKQMLAEARAEALVLALAR